MLIEISAAKSDREIVERFQTFVDPGCPLLKKLQPWTSMTKMLIGAKRHKEAVAAELFVGGLSSGERHL